jgi:hypothetical protein
VKKWKVNVSPGEATVVLGVKERAGPTWMSWFAESTGWRRSESGRRRWRIGVWRCMVDMDWRLRL